MRGWTDRVIAHRPRIVGVWGVLFVLGGLGAANLGGLLSNRFSVPGSDAEQGLDLLRDHMGDRTDGSFTLVAGGGGTAGGGGGGGGGAARGRAGGVERPKPAPPLEAGAGVVYLQIATPLENQEASRLTPELREAI